MKKSADKVRKLRQMLNMTLRKMSQETGIHYTAISRMESGRFTPKSATCQKFIILAKKHGIDIDLDWLLPR